MRGSGIRRTRRPGRYRIEDQLSKRSVMEFGGKTLETRHASIFLSGNIVKYSGLRSILDLIQGSAFEVVSVSEASEASLSSLSGTSTETGGKLSHTHPQTTSPAAFGNWWALALRGVAAILFGLVALLWPGLTLAALILVFGAYAVIDGASAVVAGVREGNGTRRWLLIAEGAFSILAGLVALFWPDITAIALLYLFAFWAIFGGLVRIVGAVLLRRELDNEWTMALSGVLSVLLGVILATIPGAGLLSLAWLIGVFALGVGLTLLAMAFRMRSSQNNDSDRVA